MPTDDVYMPTDDPGNTFSSADQLPPVEPPNPGFIVQLFVIPALIVLIMFLVGAGIKLLVEHDTNPRAYVELLRRNSAARFQAAHDLADVLRNPSNEKLKNDADLAGDLAGILNGEIDAAGMDENPIKLRTYLCHALGEFHVPDVLPVLVKAARTERDPREAPVRFAALKSLAVWLSNASAGEASGHAQLMPALLAASRDERPLLRSTAAFALGAADTPEAISRLQRMLGDGSPDVRYNAATMLARQGDDRSLGVLGEMLDPRQTQALAAEEEADGRQYKRDLILVNGLRAAKGLAEKNDQANLAPLVKAVEQLTAPELPRAIRVQAEEVLIELKQRRSTRHADESGSDRDAQGRLQHGAGDGDELPGQQH